jgi:hypothetical protein
MPVARLLGPLIAKALDYTFAGTPSFHREVKRDLGRLRKVLDKTARERLQAEKSLVARYAGTAVLFSLRRNAAVTESYHRTI